MKKFFSVAITLFILLVVCFGLPVFAAEWITSGVIILLLVMIVLQLSILLDKFKSHV